MLLVHAVDKSGKKVKFNYDPNTCSIDLAGWYFKGKKKFLPFTFENPLLHDSTVVDNEKIYEIRISLGLDCNLNCTYCNQSKTKTCVNPLPIDELVKGLSQIIAKRGADFVQIQFWGGEPLLHWELIKEIGTKLQEAIYEHGTPKNLLTFGFITNGTLLTDEIVDWLIENQWAVTISHDGTGQFLRGGDPLVTNLEVIKKLFASDVSCAFNPTITSANVPHSDVVKHITEKLTATNLVIITDAMPLTVMETTDLNDTA